MRRKQATRNVRPCRSPFSLAVTFVAVLCSAGEVAIAGGTDDRPNVVIILADDLGIGDLGCYNPDSKIPTPNLDQFAREGIRLTDLHSPSAVCTPTRYGLLTGRYAWRTRLKSGVLGNGYARSLIEPGRATIASFLRDQGYRTCAVGKWHLGFDWASTDGEPVTAGRHDHVDYSQPVLRGPGAVGFDESFIFPASLDMTPYCYLRNDVVVAAPTDRLPGSKHRRQNGGGFWRAGAASPGFKTEDVLPTLTKEAISFLKRHAATRVEQPFFLYLPLTAPHTPWMPLDEFRGRSEAGHYGDFVTQVDWSIGRVLATLNELALRDDTLVIITSDNGSHWPRGDVEKWGHAANLHYRGQKADIWEGGHRVPFIARWPGRINGGAVGMETLCLTDLFATIAAAVGEPIPAEAGPDSFNALPVLLEESHNKPIRESVVHHSMGGVFALRRGPWKLILGRGSGGFTQPRKITPKEGEPIGQLYNLLDDPGETTNLFESHPEIVQSLTNELDAIRNSNRSAPEK